MMKVVILLHIRNLLKRRKNKLFLKENYTENLNPSYFSDSNYELLYQPDVYELAYYLASRSKIRYIIDIGGGNGSKLTRFSDEFELIAIDFGDNIRLLKQTIPKARVIEANLENGIPIIKKEILENSIVIFSDVIEHLIHPEKLLKDLSEISSICKYIVITTPDRLRARGIEDFGPPANTCHVREWSIEEFYSLLKSYNFNFSMIGHTVNTDYHLWKNNIIVLGGKEVAYKPVGNLKILAIINTYNEADIIEETIYHLIRQGIDVKVFDNWSTDQTYEIVKRISDIEKRVTIERFPSEASEFYEWERLLKNVECVSAECNYEWIIHHDADEIRLSPWKNITLNSAISFIDSLGFNAIDFTVLDFRPTDNSYEKIKSFEQSLRYFEFGKNPGHFLQIKGWKVIPGINVNLSDSGGHEAQFENRKVYPIKFLTKHYPLRSPEQAKRKIFKERISRFCEEEREKGWHTQYDKYSSTDEFIWNKDILINWNPNLFYYEYFVERISGIGINR